MKLQEIENALNRFKTCPKCKSVEGFWFGLKRKNVYAQCKGCGSGFELFEVYKIDEKGRTSKRMQFFRK